MFNACKLQSSRGTCTFSSITCYLLTLAKLLPTMFTGSLLTVYADTTMVSQLVTPPAKYVDY